jgi:hypothetical protein
VQPEPTRTQAPLTAALRLQRPAQGSDRASQAGPTGNSRLTALTALVLVVLLAVEGATLISLQSFLSWHIVIGMLLVPIVALKTASTGYRFVRYYTGSPAYVRAGPPAPLLRLLGPILVLSTAGLFGTGVALAILGPGTPSVLLLHKASFVVWVGALGLHVLGHLLPLPALIRDGRSVPGSRLRLGLVALAIVAGAILAVVSWHLATPWVQQFHRRDY